MTRDQKKQYVIQLHKENKNIRDINKLTHMSFRDIGAIIKEYEDGVERENGQLEERNDDTKSKSKTTQAIKLFSEDKNLVDVVITLDLQPDEVRDIYRQFLQLQNMHELVRVFDEMQNFLPSLLELFLQLMLANFETLLIS
jgi:hypothetical protein